MTNRIGILLSVLLILSALLFTLILPASAAEPEIEVLESTARGMNLQFCTPELETAEETIGGQTYTVLYSQGCGFTSEQGKPRIPIFGFALSIPPDVDIEVSAVASEPILRNFTRISPSPFHDVVQSADQEPRIVERYEVDSAFYSASTLYPDTMATIVDLGYMQGNRVAGLRIRPFQYRPSTGELLVHPVVRIQVSFTARTPDASLLPYSGPYISVLSRAAVNYPQSEFPSPKRPMPRLGEHTQGEPEKRYRILVAEDGIYQITKRQLEVAEVALRGVDPRTISISNRGREIPILVKGEQDGSFDSGDYIEFWAEYNRQDLQATYEDMYKDPYSDYNVYWLSWGETRGIRLANESGQIVETDPRKHYSPNSYQATVHAEEDEYFTRLGQVRETCDHWFWGAIEGGRIRTFPIDLPNPDRIAQANPEITVMMRGASYPQGSPDHHVLIYMNDVLAADQTWDGQQQVKITSRSLFSSQLLDGQNTLTIVLPGDPERSAGELDAVHLNWLEVKYSRLYETGSDYIEFRPPEGDRDQVYSFEVKGFSGPQIEVYKKDISKIINTRVELVEDEDGETYYQVRFQDRVHGDNPEYVALLPTAKKSPLRIEEDEPSDLRNPGNSADYVIITPRLFSEVCERLADFRRSQGLEVKIIEVQDIYDEFNYGILSPEAIRNLLRFTLDNWHKAPRFVLLAGDGSWDYKDRYGRGNQWIPPYCTYTFEYGYTESDYSYACLTGDDLLPDMSIGRLPVSSSQGLETVLDKIIAYETSSQFGNWRRRFLFVGGLGSEFRSQSENLIANLLPPRLDASRLYAWSSSPEDDPYFGTTQTLLDKTNEGVLLINFLGHGGGAVWSDAGLLNCQGVEQLHNAGRLPFVVSLTCFTASFASPHGVSLGEQFIRSENRGAIGVFGSTGLGWKLHDYYLAQTLIPAFAASEDLTVGEALDWARLRFLSQYSGAIAETIVKEYALLGDPATRLVLPSDKMEIRFAEEISLSPGDSLHLTGTTQPARTGAAEIAAFDDKGEPLVELNVPLVDGGFSASLQVPEAATHGPAQLKVYATDNQDNDWIAQAEFSISTPFVGNVIVSPSSPTASDSVFIYASIEDQEGVKEAVCRFPTRERSVTMAPTGEDQQYVTQDALTGMQPGENVNFLIELTDNTGETFTSKTFSFRVSSGAHLNLEQLSLGGETEVELLARIRNAGDIFSEPAEAVFLCAGEELGKTSIPGIAPDSSYTCGIPVNLDGGSRTVTIQVSSLATGELKATYSEEIVVDRFAVLGETTIGPDGGIIVTLPEEYQGTVLQISSVGDGFSAHQPDLVPLSSDEQRMYAYRVIPASHSQDLEPSDTLTVSFNLSLADSLINAERENLVIARWQEQSNLWVSLGGEVDSSSISAQTSEFGVFSVMVNHDYTEPTIELAVENQHYVEGGYISANPKISAILRDGNGINRDTVRILIDGTPADASCFQLAGTNVHCLPVNLFASLAPGPHTIMFSAEDSAGNQAAKTMTFSIIPRSKVVLLGNFPNPFSRETVFAYRIEGTPLQELSIKIYSVSGHLVRSFKNFTDEEGNPAEGSEYHELTWDGTDDHGRPLANGVYFCQFKGTLENGDKWEEIIKVAKLR